MARHFLSPLASFVLGALPVALGALPASAQPAPVPAPTGGEPPAAPAPVFEDEPVTLPGTPAPPPPQAAPAGPSRAAPPGAPNAPTTLDELTISSQRARVELNLFGAMRGSLSSEEPVADFSLAPLGIMFSGRMSSSLTALAELVLETNDQGEAIVDLERVVLRWVRPLASGQLAVAAGRTHTELGYWNTAFHHGTWLQPSIERPRTLRFEDDSGLLPVHWIGVWVEHRHNLAKGALRTVLALGNGRGANVDDLRVASDVDAFKALSLHVTLADALAPGVHVGGNVLVDKIAAQSAEVRPALPDEDMFEIIASVFAAVRGDPWTVLSEGYAIVHTLPGRDTKSFEGFALVGHSFGETTPYVMVEGRASFGGSDPFFVPDPAAAPPVSDFFAVNAGVRYELSTWSSLKLEGEVSRGSGDTELEATVDWAFGL